MRSRVGANHKKQSSRQRPDAYAPRQPGQYVCALLASGWINQLHAHTPFPTTNAKIGKVFHETCQPQVWLSRHDPIRESDRFRGWRAAFYTRYDLRSTFMEDDHVLGKMGAMLLPAASALISQ